MASQIPSDPTFRSYSADQAKAYATTRLSYPQALYDIVLNHHAKTGGGFDCLLDVGCGPGNATRDVALSFNQAIGCDPGEQMIAAATGLGGTTKSGSDVRYVLSPAEEISHIDGLEPNSVDLLTSAMAVSCPSESLERDMLLIKYIRHIGSIWLSFGPRRPKF